MSEKNIGDNLYIAKAKAIIDIDGASLTTSEVLGTYLVTPIKRKILGEPKIKGFREVITGSKIIIRKKVSYEEYTQVEDIDASEHINKVGGLTWEVIDKYPASKILSYLEIKRYLSKRPETIYNDLLENFLEASRKVNREKEKIKQKLKSEMKNKEQ